MRRKKLMDKKTKMKEKKASGIWKKVLGICLAVIMGILPRKGMEARIAGIDAELQKQLAGKDCTYIDLAPQLTQKDGSIDSSLFRDGLHPNAEGYKRIAKVLKGYL